MSSLYRTFTLIVSMFLWCNSINAQHFASSLLKQSAETLQLHGLQDLPSGYTSLDYTGKKLCVIKHGDRIDHIGRVIFPQSLRELNPLPIYDYLEFAWLEQSLLSPENPYKYRDVFFETGDWNTLLKISAETPCSVSIDDGSHYHLAWNLSDGSDLRISIPVNYEIISTASRGELEKNLISDLRVHKSSVTFVQAPDSLQLQKQEDGLYLLKGDRYILSSINNNSYFQLTEDQEFKLVSDTTNITATLSNIFCAGDTISRDWDLHILFNLHESLQDTLSISVIDFTDYLKSSGCSIFWGNEGTDDTKVLGSVFAYCPEGGYNHIFKVSYSPQNDHHLSCIASLFVPTTNIRDLHMQYKPKQESEKIKWQ